MNVAIFCAYFYPHSGGVELYVKSLFSNLKGINITIITTNTENTKKHEKISGMSIYRFDCWNLLGKTYPVIKPKEYESIINILKEKKIECIVTHTRFFHTSILGSMIAKKLELPAIHFEHGTDHSPVKNPFIRLFGIAYDHTIGRKIIKNSKINVGISHASEKFIRHVYKKTSKTECIYNAVDTSKFKKTSITDQKILRSKLKIKSSDKVIVFVGRLIQPKGIQDLLEATKDIRNAKVIIIGDGNYKNELQRKYPKNIYTGSLEIKDIIRYLSIADVFVNPSYAEGLPTSVLEAGSIGVPIIATDVGGTNEIISDGKSGYLIERQNARMLEKKIHTLLADKRLQDKFSKNIRSHVINNFDINASKKKIIALLETIKK